MTGNLIDQSKCTRCELCVRICPLQILAVTNEGEVFFWNEREELCLKCGHCMAVCQPGAISIEGLSLDENFFDFPETIPDYYAYRNLLMTRRSVRTFRDKEVPMDVLGKIVESVSLAPYGVDPDNVFLTVISGRETIRKAVTLMSDLYKGLEFILKMPVIGWLMLRTMPKETRGTLKDFIMRHMKKGCYKDVSVVDDIARNAPAMILFHSPKIAGEHTADANIALTYSMLAAHSLGLGAAVIGLIGPAVNNSKPIRKMFNIPPENEVVQALILGYPKIKFHKAIVRPRKNVYFVTGDR